MGGCHWQYLSMNGCGDWSEFCISSIPYMDDSSMFNQDDTNRVRTTITPQRNRGIHPKSIAIWIPHYLAWRPQSLRVHERLEATKPRLGDSSTLPSTELLGGLRWSFFAQQQRLGSEITRTSMASEGLCNPIVLDSFLFLSPASSAIWIRQTVEAKSSIWRPQALNKPTPVRNPVHSIHYIYSSSCGLYSTFSSKLLP